MRALLLRKIHANLKEFLSKFQNIYRFTYQLFIHQASTKIRVNLYIMYFIAGRLTNHKHI